jgi:hypothetical protein
MRRNDAVPSSAVAITPSDTAVVNLCGLYVGGTGNVTVQSVEGTSVTFNACPVGAQIHLQIVRVMSTGTTATLLTGLVA